MNELMELRRTVREIVGDAKTPMGEHKDGLNRPLWDILSAHGMTGVGVQDHLGGAGGGVAEAAAIVEEASYAAAGVPLGDMLLVSNWILAAAELKLGSALNSVALDQGDWVSVEQRGGEVRLSGRVAAVPWVSVSDRIVLVLPHHDASRLVLVPTDDLTLTVGRNMAGEPIADVVLDELVVETRAVLPAPFSTRDALVRGALARTVQMTGALRAVLDISVEHALIREQFGRQLTRFQAVQQMLALMANEVAAAVAAGDGAVRAVDAGGDAEFEVAAAKVRVGAAAGTVAALGHHVHGAIGMTKEYALNTRTRRLWAWREEYGSEAYWSERLADLLQDLDSPALWDRIVR